MDSVRRNFVCAQGATFTEVIVYSENGVAVDLTTYTAKMQAREKYDTVLPSISLTSGSGLTLGADGSIIIHIPSTDTAKLVPKKYVYDLVVITGSEVTRLIFGEFIVTPGVTR